MDNLELAGKINSFSNAQISEFNIECNNKIHSVNQTMITNSDKEEAVEVAEYLNGMSSEDVQSLNPSLSLNKKLSGRPC